MVVGAGGEDSIVANSGAAYAFTRSGVTWTEQLILKAPNPDANDTTLVDEGIYSAHSSSVDPVIWNNDLYFAVENGQSGSRLIMHCVD